MKTSKIYLSITLMLLSIGLFAQAQEKEDLLTEIKLKSYYFQHLAGDIDVNEQGILSLNGVNMDMKNVEIGYQTSEDGDNFIYFITSNNKHELEAWNNGKLLYKTNNVLHLIRSKEQAVELVVLFNLLKTFYVS